jgi:hypothetical protein
MPPRKAAPPPAASAQHQQVGALRFYAGSLIVFVSAGLSFALAQSAEKSLVVAARMWLMNAGICLLASWLTGDHSWCADGALIRTNAHVQRVCSRARWRTPRLLSEGVWLRPARRVDRLWSVTPCFYALHFAAASEWAPRPTLMAALTLLWGARLSWNFARKAGYQARAQQPCLAREQHSAATEFAFLRIHSHERCGCARSAALSAHRRARARWARRTTAGRSCNG